jgi:hypothetical protein
MSKMRATALAGLALGLAACGSAAPAAHHPATAATTRPHISAAAACSDFEHWYLTTNKGQAGDLARLTRAVQESPSGTLYQDMSALEQAVESGLSGAVNAQSFAVLDDCQAINPNQGG